MAHKPIEEFTTDTALFYSLYSISCFKICVDGSQTKRPILIFLYKYSGGGGGWETRVVVPGKNFEPERFRHYVCDSSEAEWWHYE